MFYPSPACSSAPQHPEGLPIDEWSLSTAKPPPSTIRLPKTASESRLQQRPQPEHPSATVLLLSIASRMCQRQGISTILGTPAYPLAPTTSECHSCLTLYIASAYATLPPVCHPVTTSIPQVSTWRGPMHLARECQFTAKRPHWRSMACDIFLCINSSEW